MRLPLACGAALAAVLCTPASAAAYCRLTTVDPPADQLCSSAGIPLAWWDRCSTVVVLPRTKPGITSPQILDTLQLSFDTWNAVRCRDGAERPFVGLLTDVSDEAATETTPQHNRSGHNENAVMFVDSAAVWFERDNPRNAIGLTSVFHSTKTGRILGADMEMNDWNVTWSLCGTRCANGATDLQNVFTHEIGHYYGLGHVIDPDATMYVSAPAGDIGKRDLASDDVDGICAAYPPGTFYETCTGSTYADRHADDGCGCSTVGASRAADWKRRGVLPTFLVALVLSGLVIRTRRTRRSSYNR